MATDEPILTERQAQDTAVHVRDYTFFTKLVKWTLFVTLTLAFIVVFLIIK